MGHKQLLANYRRAVTRMEGAKRRMRDAYRLAYAPVLIDKLERQEAMAIRAYSRALRKLNDFEQSEAN